MANVNKIDIEGEQWDIEDTQARLLAEAAQETADEAQATVATKQDAKTAVTHTENVAVGNSSTPVYVDANGQATTITKDTIPTGDSQNLVTSGGVVTYLKRAGNWQTQGSSTRVQVPTTDGVHFMFVSNSVNRSQFLLFLLIKQNTSTSWAVILSNGLSINHPEGGVVVIDGSSGTLYSTEILLDR